MAPSDGSGTRPEQRHVVGVYDDHDDLVAAVAAYLGDALQQDGTAIIVATPEHRAACVAALAGLGYSIETLAAAGRYRELDARETLARFMAGAEPDPRAFATSIGDVLAAPRARGPVHVFGEMVALLWDAGNITGAIELESLWNTIAAEHSFALFCAYAMSSLEASGDLVATREMCDRHACVMAWEPVATRDQAYANGAGANGRTGSTGASWRHERMFVAAPAAIPRVRAFVRETLGSWGDDPDDSRFGDAELVASELATNAVKHARTPFRVSLSRRGCSTRVAVRDTSFDRPCYSDRGIDAPGGRGIGLLAQVSQGWGVQRELDGKTVWAEITSA